MDRYRRRRPTRQGFTLMEVLLVLVILVILGSMATMFIRGAQRKARADAARSQIGIFDNAVKMFELNALSYSVRSAANNKAPWCRTPGKNRHT